MDRDCIFCKISRKELPTTTVYEDDKFIAFLDINPVREGHTLLVPKDHYRWFTDLPSDLYDEMFRTAKTLALRLQADYQADYVRLGIVGKDVPHTHIHLVPQKMTEDGPRI